MKSTYSTYDLKWTFSYLKYILKQIWITLEYRQVYPNKIVTVLCIFSFYVSNDTAE